MAALEAESKVKKIVTKKDKNYRKKSKKVAF